MIWISEDKDFNLNEGLKVYKILRIERQGEDFRRMRNLQARTKTPNY
jgi:hypothetical protein